MRISAAGLLSLVFLGGPLAAEEAGGPLSAIDWLSESVATPASAATPAPSAGVDEPPVTEAGGALPAQVTTSTLDGPSPDGVGLIAPAVSGLPLDLWGAGLTREIAERLVSHPDDDLPALRQLFLTLLLAEVAAPVDAGGRGELLQVRIDKLLAILDGMRPDVPAEAPRRLHSWTLRDGSIVTLTTTRQTPEAIAEALRAVARSIAP